MALVDTATPEDAGLARRPTAIAAVVTCAALLVASLGANALLHAAERGTGATTTSIQARAFFQDPTSVGTGVTVRRPLEFVIVVPSTLPVTWVAYNRGRVAQRGTAVGGAGTSQVETLVTSTLRHRTWLTIAIKGIRAPLRAWVK